MATNTASIEKVVRKVLDEELDERNQATLEAIERLGRVLTEAVIPRLSEDAGTDEIEVEPGDGSERRRAMHAGYSKSDIDDSGDDADLPEDADAPPASAVPPEVSEALEALYASLSAEQASALEELFAAIAQARTDEGDEIEAPPVEHPSHKLPRARLAS